MCIAAIISWCWATAIIFSVIGFAAGYRHGKMEKGETR